MTAIVGVLCTDGVVIGTDSSATFTAGQHPTIEQPTEKLHVIGNAIIVAGTGAVGFGQRFCDIVDRSYQQDLFRERPLHIGRVLSKSMIQDLSETFCNPGGYGALVAFPIRTEYCLCEFGITDFQPELKNERIWYVSQGSGQRITDPFLALMRDVYWAEGPPTVYDAVFAVTWALDHAVDVNPGGINRPVRIAILETTAAGPRARILGDDELEEHRQHIGEGKTALRQMRTQQVDAADALEIPPLPAE